MKNVIASAGLIALGAAGVQTAQAQIPVVGPEKPWSVAATLRGFYDDNYNTQPSGPGRRHSFGFEARPSVGVNLPLEDTTVTLGYVLDMKYYEDRKQNSADWSHDFEAFINHNFDERHSIDFRDSFVIAQEPEVLDPSLSTVLRSDGNNIRNLAVLNFHAQFTRLFGIAAGYSNTYYNYQDRNDTATRTSFATLLNRFEHLFTLDTRWQVLPTTTGIVGYQFGWVDYTRDNPISPLFPVTSKERNNRSQYFYVGAEHAFRRDLTASAKVGVQYGLLQQSHQRHLLEPVRGPQRELCLHGWRQPGRRVQAFAQSNGPSGRGVGHQLHHGRGVIRVVCHGDPKIE